METLSTFRLLSSPEVFQNPSIWDNEVGPHAHPYQSTSFALFQSTRGLVPYFAQIFSGEVKIGACLFFLGKGKIASCYYGPVMLPSSPVSKEKCVEELIFHLRNLGASGIDTFYLPVDYSGPLSETSVHATLHPTLRLVSSETPVIDIPAFLKVGLKAVDHSVRKNVRKCTDAGVVIEFRRDEEALAIYLKMLVTHRKKLGERLPPFYPNRQTLAFFDRPGSLMEIALATINGVPLSGMGYLVHGKILTEIAVAQSEEYFRLKLPAQDLIKIKAIEHYGAAGLEYYDLAGIASNPTDEKEINIRRFKLKFTGTTRQYFKMPRLPFKPTQYWSHLCFQKLIERARLSR